MILIPPFSVRRQGSQEVDEPGIRPRYLKLRLLLMYLVAEQPKEEENGPTMIKRIQAFVESPCILFRILRHLHFNHPKSRIFSIHLLCDY